MNLRKPKINWFFRHIGEKESENDDFMHTVLSFALQRLKIESPWKRSRLFGSNEIEMSKISTFDSIYGQNICNLFLFFRKLGCYT